MNAHAALKAPYADLASAKRGPTERKGVHAWHPYYAGYSERFVESALRYLGRSAGDLILDPWAGSGTTGVVAARLGMDSLCLDINPVMATFSAAKSPEVLKERERILAWLERLPSRPRQVEVSSNDPLSNIFEHKTAAHFRAILGAVPFPESDMRSVQALDAKGAAFDAGYAFCRAVVFVTLRRLSGTQKLQNPTWLRAGADVEVPSESLTGELAKDGRAMLDQLAKLYGNTSPNGRLASTLGDARAMPLKAASVDGIVTSPPYLTRIDYAVSTSPEMMIFGDKELLEFVRHETMGAPVITKVAREQKTAWGTKCNAVLDAVKSHPTKAAHSYYWKNIIQYFMDMDRALAEVKRVLKPNSSGLIVVQSSYFKEVEIPLGEIYVEAARGLGMSASIVAREPVKTHMAHVNTRSQLYKTNKVYYEDVVEVRPTT
jgi:DNA modification methylase